LWTPNTDERAAHDGQEDKSGLMKITTSRDPSAKARSFGRLLSAFLSVPYITRGKRSLDEEDTWLVVVENHGNPSGLAKRFGDQTEKLAFTLMPDANARSRRLKSMRPLVTGKKDDALAIARFFELDWLERPSNEATIGRYIKVASGQIDFVDQGETIFRLKI
jgi:rRNA maturation protein Rpf1